MFNTFGFGFMDSVFPVLFSLFFLLILGMIVVSIFRGVQQYRVNEASPTLSVDAMVVTKREDVSYSHTAGANDTMLHSSHTTYYATFQVESGDRMEFALDGKAFGMLAEGDLGRLTFQGTRYLGFERASQ